jgi:hypothetical protein
MGKPQQVTTIENQFAVFSNLTNVHTNDHKLQKQPKGTNTQQSVRNREKNKIILTGDSHMKGYAPELRNRLGENLRLWVR